MSIREEHPQVFSLRSTWTLPESGVRSLILAGLAKSDSSSRFLNWRVTKEIDLKKLEANRRVCRDDNSVRGTCARLSILSSWSLDRGATVVMLIHPRNVNDCKSGNAVGWRLVNKNYPRTLIGIKKIK
jgi:hypothetical protein